MFGLGMGEMVVILMVVLLFLGPKKIPQLAKGLGEGIKEFKNSIAGKEEEEEEKKRPDQAS
jgi:sec-independent protein translocase protein TatA